MVLPSFRDNSPRGFFHLYLAWYYPTQFLTRSKSEKWRQHTSYTTMLTNTNKIKVCTLYDNDIDDLFYLVRLGFGCATGTGIDRGASATGTGRNGGLSCFILLMHASLKSLQYDLSSFERLSKVSIVPPLSTIWTNQRTCPSGILPHMFGEFMFVALLC